MRMSRGVFRQTISEFDGPFSLTLHRQPFSRDLLLTMTSGQATRNTARPAKTPGRHLAMLKMPRSSVEGILDQQDYQPGSTRIWMEPVSYTGTVPNTQGFARGRNTAATRNLSFFFTNFVMARLKSSSSCGVPVHYRKVS